MDAHAETIQKGRNKMRIKITEIEATSQDLKESRTLSEVLNRLLKASFEPKATYAYEEDETEENDDGREDD